MTAKLIRYGDGAALVLDKAILDTLSMPFDTFFELTFDGTKIILCPKAEKGSEQDILDALKRVNQKYPHALKKLGE